LDSDTDKSELSEDGCQLEGEDEDDIIKGVQDKTGLLAFASRLQEAHNEMVERQKEKRVNTKRKPHYTSNSERTKQRRREKWKNLEKAGFPSVLEFFGKKKSNPGLEVSPDLQ
jgi:hypothetical protein